MTTNWEHAAMEAAGMDDAELAANLKALPADPSRTATLLLRACTDEREYRNQARFQRDLQAKRSHR